MNKNTTLLPVNAEIIIRPTNDEKHFDSINIKSFTEHFKGPHFVENFRHVWEKSSEYLKKISVNSKYKNLKQATLDIAKEDLNFGQKQAFQEQPTLDQRIAKTHKNSMSMKLKPRGQ